MGLAWLGLVLGLMVPAWGHVGMPYVVLEGRAGKYPVRVVIQQPEVVPGLAQIGVRILEGVPGGVTVLPLHWNTDRSGAPRPDRALAVPEIPGLYEAELWFMSSGAYGVLVEVEGEGGGTLMVPANSLAKASKPLPGWMAVMLGILGSGLLVGWVALGVAAFRESTVLVREVRGRWIRGTIGGVLAASVALAGAWGFFRWWKLEAADHQRRIDGQTLTMKTRVEGSSLIFDMASLGDRRREAWEPVPDHGRLLHAFVIGPGPEPVFLHLHPESAGKGRVRAGLGGMPAGEYTVFLDVTHALGAVQTATDRLVLAEAIPDGQPEDRDDAWHRGALSMPGQKVDLGDGQSVQLGFEGDEVRAGDPVRMQVRYTDADGRPSRLEAYLTMPGHAVIASEDGSVFSHIHPAGNLSMASARRFALRAGGETAAKSMDEVCGDLTALPPAEAMRILATGEVQFPVLFPKAGPYRVWVQARIGGRVRTAGYRVEVAGARER
jgi:hypothetical protein